MFGIGIWELAVIGLVAILFLGPEKLPQFAKQAAQLVRHGRTIARAARDQVRNELGPEFADLEIRDLNPKAFVAKHIQDAVRELDEAEGLLPAAESAPLAKGERPPFDDQAT